MVASVHGIFAQITCMCRVSSDHIFNDLVHFAETNNHALAAFEFARAIFLHSTCGSISVGPY